MKELSEIEHDTNGYHFECRWDSELDIETEIEEARKHCAVVSSFEVPVINKDPHRAIISGRGRYCQLLMGRQKNQPRIGSKLLLPSRSTENRTILETE